MSTTINKEEIQKFSKLADEWWDVNGKFKPLHMFNPIRIEYITEKIKQHFKIKGNGKMIDELEKNESIDKKLLRYLTIKVKKFNLDINYFGTKKEDNEKMKKNKN